MADKPEVKETPATDKPGAGGKKPIWTELLEVGIGHFAITGGIEAIKGLIAGFAKETGEKVAKQHIPDIIFALFGIRTEDERRFNRARERMDPADYTRLTKKLRGLAPEIQDYYRLTVLCERDADTTKILTKDARMAKQTWARHCKILNYRAAQAESQQVVRGFRAWLAETDQQFTLAVKRQTRRTRNWTRRQKANNFGIEQEPPMGFLGQLLYGKK